MVSKCDMDNWECLVDGANVVSKERPINEDSSEELVDGGDGVVVEGGASRHKTGTIK